MEDQVSCAGCSMSVLEIVRAWMAFRVFHKRERIHVAFSGREFARARAAGWDLGFRLERNYRARMCDDPWDFYNGFEWGVDLVWAGSDGGLAHPNELAQRLLKDVGASIADEHFLQADVDHWSARFTEGLKQSRAWKC